MVLPDGPTCETSEAGGFLQRERESLDHHLLVPVADTDRLALHAIAYAESLFGGARDGKAAARVAAVHVTDDRKAAAQLQTNWNATHLGIPLVVLESPYRETAEALIRYIDFLQSTGGPRTVVTVVLPETMPVRWWHPLLRNYLT